MIYGRLYRYIIGNGWTWPKVVIVLLLAINLIIFIYLTFFNNIIENKFYKSDINTTDSDTANSILLLSEYEALNISPDTSLNNPLNNPLNNRESQDLCYSLGPFFDVDTQLNVYHILKQHGWESHLLTSYSNINSNSDFLQAEYEVITFKNYNPTSKSSEMLENNLELLAIIDNQHLQNISCEGFALE